MFHASTLRAMVAFAYGHDAALPCLMPHMKFALTLPCLVMIMTGIWCACSAAHCTNPCGGHPRLRRAVHMSSGVIRSKNFSSSSASCPSSLC